MSKRRAVTFAVQKEEVALKQKEEDAPPKKTSLEAKLEGAMQFVAFQAYYGNNVPLTPATSSDEPDVARDKQVLLAAQELYKSFSADLKFKWTLAALKLVPPDLRDAFKQHPDLVSVVENDKMTLSSKEIACSHSGAVAALHVVLHCLEYMKALAYEQFLPQQDSFVQLWTLLNETPAFVDGYKALLNALKTAEMAQ